RPVSGWGFLGVPSGVARDDTRTNYASCNHFSGWGFLSVPSGVAGDDTRINYASRDRFNQ
ncbi:MAG: hypothetical protein ABEH81_13360, partial [Halopenitus sp.]